MEQNSNKEWHVKDAGSSQMDRDDDSLLRAINLIIAKEGTFRTDENWVHRAVDPLVEAGILVREGSVISVGDNFEPTLVDIATVDQRFQESLTSYRALVTRQAESYGVIDTDIYDKLASLSSTEEKIIFLCGTLAETSGKLNVALEKANILESKLKEMDLSLSVLESISYDDDENPDS
tara:strand:+ start:888 stop:1421 length:534 start_codon:yes stop_codon:yes gene_type:complete